MLQETTLQEARRLLFIAMREIPQLTPFGIGVHYAYHRNGREHVCREIQRQQAELETDHALRMIAFCADWIKTHPTGFKPHRTSYYSKHLVEQWRRDAGDPDPYVHNGCFIAAAVGLGLNFRIDGPNAVFRFPTLRQLIDRALCADGQRLRGNKIVQIYDEVGPMMLPCEPRVIEDDVDLETLARELGVL
ncbi:MAG TPA: hypothetical protein VFA33_22505 [Bryobacteraceae bacterium]|nr:hypothetical protein [Bryobacteraceae bacterium]